MDIPVGSRLGHVCGVGFIRKKQNSRGWDIGFGVLKDEYEYVCLCVGDIPSY